MEIGYSIAALLVSALALLVSALALLASAHVILTKRDNRAAFAWVALLFLVPLLGAILYYLFGINRIRHRAGALNRRYLERPDPAFTCVPTELAAQLGEDAAHLTAIAEVTGRVAARSLVRGNVVEHLVDGERAYASMLETIDGARSSITLATYIFGNDRVGQAFADALQRAVQRGVHVRVLIDNAGERYTWPSMVGVLRRRKVPVARFFPRFPVRLVGMNLRNHRKLLVVDGHIGYTGGMNLRAHHLVAEGGRRATRDLHFKLCGPVVRQLQAVFSDDWGFATGEWLDGPIWFPALDPKGPVTARGLRTGPDENLRKLEWALLSAITSARRSIRIMTPYFLPDRHLIAGLNLASLRGVQVDIVLPATNNLPFVHWAMMAQLWQTLEYDCRVWFTPRPFDHSKLMVVDGAWSLIGSANWDPRSLRLNFEFNVECYDRDLALQLEAEVDRRIAMAKRITIVDVDSRSLPAKLRDGVFRLFTPYL
jgi:cardiolipin synthase A/B